MLGMGREWGIPMDSPSWIRRSKLPASTRASLERGGVLSSPLSRASGFLVGPSATGVLPFAPDALLYAGPDIVSRGYLRAAILTPQRARKGPGRRDGPPEAEHAHDAYTLL